MKKIVGKVTENEKDQILKLFERLNGLKELAKIITKDDEDLYEKLVADLGLTSRLSQKWWNDMSEKYSWESTPTGRWEINFDTCEIYLLG